MQAACGRWRSAIATISSVAAISKLSGSAIAADQPRDVVVDDVAAILAQMRGDAVGAGGLRDLRGAHRIGMQPAARVADRRDMIDVDAEAQSFGHGLRHAGSGRAAARLDRGDRGQRGRDSSAA